jgi:hypothetical protein
MSAVEQSLVEQRDALLQYAMALEERNGKVGFLVLMVVCAAAARGPSWCRLAWPQSR